MDYGKLSDEELVKLSKTDEAAENFLLMKHKPLVLQFARTLYLTYGDKDDLIQEGMIGLFHAIHSYREEEGTRFVTLAHTCVRNQMLKAVASGTRGKDIPASGILSLDDETFGEGDWAASTVGNPEQIVIDRENADLLEEHLKSRLSGLEKEVLSDYIGGMTYLEIAEKLGREPKSIDNAIQRIKSKMREILKERERK